MSELHKSDMSLPMWRSYQKALDEALLDVRKKNSAIWNATEEIRYEWNRQNATIIEEARDRYDETRRQIQEKINELHALERQAFDDYKKRDEEIWAQMWEETAPQREAFTQEQESIHKEWEEIQERVNAIYRARLELKKMGA